MGKKVNIFISFIIATIICLGIFSFIIKPIRSFNRFEYINHSQTTDYYTETTNTNSSFKMPLFNYGGYRHKDHSPFLGGNLCFKIISIVALIILIILFIYFFFF